jgi:AAA15 family ATPase/GTPase
MIHELKIKNLYSFKEEQIFSFEASSDKTYEDLYCTEVKPGLKLLKLAVIYGANASGKTNFLNVLDFIRQIILSVPNEKLKGINLQAFLLDENSRNENSSFSISFYLGATRYIYELELNSDHIVFEKLAYYPATQPALVFERSFNSAKRISKLKFGSTIEVGERDKIILEGDLIINATLLSVYLRKNVNIPVLEAALSWFSKNMSPKTDSRNELRYQSTERIYKSEKEKDFTLELLQKADFNIVDIDLEKEEKDEQRSGMFEESVKLYIVMGYGKRKRINFVHRTGSGKNATLPYDAQSEGTKRFFELSSILAKLLEDNSFVPLDELETSLHPDLTDHFIKTFLANSKNSQLLFTTHNLMLLDSDYIRRDAVWFCEKNEEGATELFSAHDFGLHKNISLFNAYKIGKFGAKPKLGSIFLDSYGKI